MTTPSYSYLPPPPAAKGLTLISEPGVAEIRPHHRAGILGALNQLTTRGGTRRGRPVKRFVITYLPVHLNAELRPQLVCVFATPFSDQRQPSGGRPLEKPEAWINRVLAQPWRHLGEFKPPEVVPVDLRDPAIFGRVIEQGVRERFIKMALAANRRRTAQPQPGQRSPHRKADLTWELADMYHELAQVLGNPFYRALAEELTIG